MNWNGIRANKKNFELKTFTTGEIKASYKTYTQFKNNKPIQGRIDCIINAFGFTHADKGDILIDVGFSNDFYKNPPYGNLGLILKIFQKINNVSYTQQSGEDIVSHLVKQKMNPKHVFLTHLHPDHTSGIPYLDDDITIYHGKDEDNFYYKLLTKNHIKNKKRNLIDLNKGIDLEMFEKVIDVFGDKSLLAISTKGHTKDHISYLVNGIEPYLIVGDAELTKEAVNRGIYVNSDYGKKGEADARESAEKLRLFIKNHPEIVVCYSHDL